MIPITDLSWQSLSWQKQLSHSIRSCKDLAQVLNLDLQEIDTGFPVNVPLAYLSRIESGNLNDPLLRQVLATELEFDLQGETSPLSEEAFDQGFGLIQKYTGRVLVITTGACAIHCRYCFRRHFPYEQHQPSQEDWQGLLAKLHANDNISEVILSGGDPLMLSDRRLAWIFAQISQIPQIETIRLHTRLPIVLPARITPRLTEMLTTSRCNVVLVTHANHGNEIDQEVMTACRHLSSRGVTLLNQSVLLKDINDSVSSLGKLSKKLLRAGIVPYYLHLMDPVMGAGHFNVEESRGVELIRELRRLLPGYLVPRLSQEVPFESAKRVVL